MSECSWRQIMKKGITVCLPSSDSVRGADRSFGDGRVIASGTSVGDGIFWWLTPYESLLVVAVFSEQVNSFLGGIGDPYQARAVGRHWVMYK